MSSIDLVLFEVGGVRYGAELRQVRRVDLPQPDLDVGAPLGPCLSGRRALVFEVEAGERSVRVDEVLGVRRVETLDLRRLPAAVAASPMSLGAWLDGDRPIVLIDLHALPTVFPAHPGGLPDSN
jgi:chemotaxis signal transduction protein